VSDLIPILEQFQLGGKILKVEPFGSGYINETYRSTVQGQPRQYVHQKINTHVFRHPEFVMENMVCVTRHIQQKFDAQPDERRRATLEIVPTRDGRLYYQDAHGEYWRTTICILDVMAYDTIQNPTHAFEVGRTLGEFQRVVADIPTADLHDTLPGFHHSPRYYKELLTAFDTPQDEPAIEQRKNETEVTELFAHIQQQASFFSVLMDAFRTGALQEGVTHNDPKVNNILLDVNTHLGVGMIDLDTVKAGLLQFDYGDCLRSAANPAGETTDNLRNVYFDMGIFEEVTRGYLQETRDILSETDIAMLVDAIKLITLEQATRFLTDYVNGDVYYHISYPTHNLDRATIQWTLFQDLKGKERDVRHTLKACL
jgi:Ser/Thr protein kinase RdoA (MazF antagonist)